MNIQSFVNCIGSIVVSFLPAFFQLTSTVAFAVLRKPGGQIKALALDIGHVEGLTTIWLDRLLGEHLTRQHQVFEDGLATLSASRKTVHWCMGTHQVDPVLGFVFHEAKSVSGCCQSFHHPPKHLATWHCEFPNLEIAVRCRWLSTAWL